jgi:hypothetical protein
MEVGLKESMLYSLEKIWADVVPRSSVYDFAFGRGERWQTGNIDGNPWRNKVSYLILAWLNRLKSPHPGGSGHPVRRIGMRWALFWYRRYHDQFGCAMGAPLPFSNTRIGSDKNTGR